MLVGPLQRELVFRLLSAGTFTQQLAGIKELFGLLLRAGALAVKLNEPAAVTDMLAWITERDIVHMVLASNLHHQQYAEHAQKVLCFLLKQGGLSDAHLDFLWHLTEDGATHEEIRANAHYILGSLAPHMAVTQRDKLFQQLLMRAAAAPSAYQDRGSVAHNGEA